MIQISPGGIVKGEIKAPYLSIEKGAIFTGSIDMGDGGIASAPSAAPAVEAPKPAPAPVVAAAPSPAPVAQEKKAVAPVVAEKKVEAPVAAVEAKSEEKAEYSDMEKELSSDSDY